MNTQIAGMTIVKSGRFDGGKSIHSGSPPCIKSVFFPSVKIIAGTEQTLLRNAWKRNQSIDLLRGVLSNYQGEKTNQS